MPKTKIGQEVRKRLGLLEDDQQEPTVEVAAMESQEPVVSLEAEILSEIGMYLGIESRPGGFVVVSLSKEGNVLVKKDEYALTKSKGQALEGFKLASGRFIVNFNQNSKAIK